jgi:ribosomal-protein-alanine N-acetyltransferase
MPVKLIKIESLLGLPAQVFSDVKKLDQNFFPTPWTQESWDGLFIEKERHFLTLGLEEKDLLGFSLFETFVADSFAHLLKIIVDPEKRVKGVGKEILSFSINELKRLGIKNFFLEVEEKNHAAIALYEHFGFKVIHHKKHFYSNGENALIMTLGA